MTKGFMIIDKDKNTLIVDDNELMSLVIKAGLSNGTITKHKTLKDLDQEVHAYIKEVNNGQN